MYMWLISSWLIYVFKLKPRCNIIFICLALAYDCSTFDPSANYFLISGLIQIWFKSDILSVICWYISLKKLMEKSCFKHADQCLVCWEEHHGQLKISKCSKEINKLLFLMQKACMANLKTQAKTRHPPPQLSLTPPFSQTSIHINDNINDTPIQFS